ncbi:MAG: carbohydrate porin [Ignavibacteriales bacterium]|nr:carbohydrate porin [Ignavibacteriales bacterium]
MKHYYIISILFLLYAARQNFAQNNLPSASPLTSSTSYIGNTVSNLSGGLREGSSYLGLMNWTIEATLENTQIPGSGLFHVNIANSHGSAPSSVFVGDYQGISNIEGGSHTFIYELWYKHTFSNLFISLGLQDLNAEFANSGYAALFLNSSFGIHPTIASGAPSPIYPLTTLGIVTGWDVADTYSLKLGLFDGLPENFENNEHNIDWCLCRECGFMAIAEIQKNTALFYDLPGTVKLGVYFSNSANYAKLDASLEAKNYGFYGVFEQTLAKNQNSAGAISFFSQIGFTPQASIVNNLYYSIGLHHTGLFSGRPDDVAGLALASAVFHNHQVGSETALELTYQVSLHEHFFVKPDLQYIINPAGTDEKLHNALAASLQFGFNF